MPDANGNFKGIVVTKVWPGHRDYERSSDMRKPCDATALGWECELLADHDGPHRYEHALWTGDIDGGPSSA